MGLRPERVVSARRVSLLRQPTARRNRDRLFGRGVMRIRKRRAPKAAVATLASYGSDDPDAVTPMDRDPKQRLIA